MSTFNRGLDKAFVDALNEEYDKGGWWRNLVDDKDTFIAIRENYVNAYYCGCSLLKLIWKTGVIVGEIHYKYLLRSSICNQYEYVRVVDGRANLPDDTKSMFLSDIYNNVDDLKNAVGIYAEDEKKGVQNILDSNPNILDVEIAFGVGGSAPRVDLVAIQNSSESAEIVFFEAKRFDNRKELRADGRAKPKVIQQIETYQRKLRENRDAVIDSYRRVCCNLRSLRGMAERYPERHAMLEGVADGSRKLLVDENPGLLVFGFDADQKDGKNWKPHCEKLKTMLPKRAFFKGDSRDFVCDISK